MVKIAAVVDSACLIGLERIGRLDLLPALLDPILPRLRSIGSSVRSLPG